MIFSDKIIARAVARLVHGRAVGREVTGIPECSRPEQHTAEIGQDVPKKIRGHDHIELLRALYKLVGDMVHIEA